ncbi:MAG: ABC transporter ATP-binding protein [Thermoanaerobaculia bacterium]|nr:ABC transporter ATP-binding protein [Thermoanaerobaculia bacterium]
MRKGSIRIRGLSKRYRIGVFDDRPETLLGAASDLVMRPLRNLKRLRSLTRFGDGDSGDSTIWALKDISLDIHPGEVVGVIGHNGAGKTTLLKILSQITHPTRGRVELDGRVSSLLEVGTGFHPELTGRENVYLNGVILGMRKREVDRKFDAIVDFSGIRKFIDTPVKRYSSGMRVRLAFSVSAHLEPEILLIDEVLSVGDAQFQRKCLGKMDEARHSGRTILFVSHQMAMVTALCDRVILLDRGQVQMDGTSEEAVFRYLGASSSTGTTWVTLGAEDHGDDGSGRLSLRRWAVEDAQLGLGTEVRCGHRCAFHVEYEAPESSEGLEQLSIAMTIKDLLGTPLLTASTHLVGADFQTAPRRGIVKLELEQLPLIPGTYRVHLWTSVQGVAAAIARDAGQLEVLPGDPLGTGRLPRAAAHGVFLLSNYSWSISESLDTELPQSAGSS